MKAKNLSLFSSPEMLTVDELTQEIRSVLTRSPALSRFYLRGELQGFKRHTSGHLYFTLLGKEARIAGVLFRADAMGVVDWAQDGVEVCAEGRIDVYPARGSYQLYASRLFPLGQGAQAKARAELELRLEKEGYFAVSRKRPLPLYPLRVAVLTSPTGAAVRDVLEVAAKRFPAAEITVIPTLVQGVQAPHDIENAFLRCSQLRSLDAVMLVRGGGSRDDLNPFDDERVVRSIANCPFPVISGVGHQIDATLADRVADAFAPTPSAAAETLFPDSAALLSRLQANRALLVSLADKKIEKNSAKIQRQTLLLRQRMSRLIDTEKTSLNTRSALMQVLMQRKIYEQESHLAKAKSSLQALSPIAILQRGYTLCQSSSGKIVKSVDHLVIGESLELIFKDGRASVQVLEKIYSSVEG